MIFYSINCVYFKQQNLFIKLRIKIYIYINLNKVLPIRVLVILLYQPRDISNYEDNGKLPLVVNVKHRIIIVVFEDIAGPHLNRKYR